MEINTVRILEYGEYFVNERTTIPNRPGNGYYDAVQDWIALGNTPTPYVEPEPSWLDKRLANMENGGYGTTGEQFEMIGEQGMEAYQAHIAKVKSDIPKEI